MLGHELDEIAERGHRSVHILVEYAIQPKRLVELNRAYRRVP